MSTETSTLEQRGTIVVVERYRDRDGYQREYYGCQTCGRLTNGRRGADAGMVHDCSTDAVLAPLQAGPDCSAAVPLGTLVYCYQVGHQGREHPVTGQCLGLLVAQSVDWYADGGTDVVTTSPTFGAGVPVELEDGRYRVAICGFAYAVEVSGGTVSRIGNAGKEPCRLECCATV